MASCCSRCAASFYEEDVGTDNLTPLPLHQLETQKQQVAEREHKLQEEQAMLADLDEMLSNPAEKLNQIKEKIIETDRRRHEVQDSRLSAFHESA